MPTQMPATLLLASLFRFCREYEPQVGLDHIMLTFMHFTVPVTVEVQPYILEYKIFQILLIVITLNDQFLRY